MLYTLREFRHAFKTKKHLHTVVHICIIPTLGVIAIIHHIFIHVHHKMFSSYIGRGHKNIQSPYRITPIFNALSPNYISQFIYCTQRMLVAKREKKREKEGSKRWTSVLVIKTMGTRCPPP